MSENKKETNLGQWKEAFQKILFGRFEIKGSFKDRYPNKRIKILSKRFPFYNKLTADLKKAFLKKVNYFVSNKRFTDYKGNELSEKKKVLISAYAAQICFGLKDFKFSRWKQTVVFPYRFYSDKRKSIVSWEWDEKGVVYLSWEELYRELKKNKLEEPALGIKIMANALKRETINSLYEEIYTSQTSQYFLNASGLNQSLNLNNLVFEEKAFSSKSDFVEACIINYFSKPNELKNNFPELFKKIELSLYEGV